MARESPETFFVHFRPTASPDRHGPKNKFAGHLKIYQFIQSRQHAVNMNAAKIFFKKLKPQRNQVLVTCQLPSGVIGKKYSTEIEGADIQNALNKRHACVARFVINDVSTWQSGSAPTLNA